MREYCEDYLYFTFWNVDSLLLGQSGSHVAIQNSSSNYVQTNDTINCPITQYSLKFIQGNDARIKINQ